MNVALALALFTATITLGTAAIHLAISRAPGWRASRAFAAIAFTGGLYCIGNLVFASAEQTGARHQIVLRLNYLFAHLHALAWFPWLLGGPEARWREVPQTVRRLCGASLGIALFFLLTGLQIDGTPNEVSVPWAHVVYHYFGTTPLGDVYGYFLVAQLLVPFGILIARIAQGARELAPTAIGFALYLVCAVVEALVANGVLVTLSPADLGFLAVILPSSFLQVRRFIDDARRLRDLSGQLAGEVRERTEERDRAQLALAEAERLAALGRLSAGVGHEINNPLTYLQGSLDRVSAHLEAQGAPADVREALADARDGAWRIEKVVEGLRTYSRRHEERAPLDLRDVARAALKVAKPSLRHEAELEIALEEAPRVFGDEPRLVQALVNLLTNAAQAVAEHGGSGRVLLRTGTTAAGEPFFDIEDEGPGIPAEHLARVGEPYFTTRGPRGGLGLGLFTTRGIVDAHGGRLEISAAPRRGTRARIVLPRFSAAEPALRARETRRAGATLTAAPHAAPPERPRLLLVDDEPRLLRLLAQLLGTEWEVVEADSAAAARALLAAGSFDMLLCDLMMSGISGIQLADEIAARAPALRARMVFMTGGAITPEAEQFLARPDVLAVSKPMNFDALRRLLRERRASALASSG